MFLEGGNGLRVETPMLPKKREDVRGRMTISPGRTILGLAHLEAVTAPLGWPGRDRGKVLRPPVSCGPGCRVLFGL